MKEIHYKILIGLFKTDLRYNQVMQKYTMPQTMALDTNVISFIVRPPGGNPPPKTMKMIKASKKWWGLVEGFNFVISATTLREISKGAKKHSQKRKELVLSMKLLDDGDDITALADKFKNKKIFSKNKHNDAMILANACINKNEFLVTCNMKDLVSKRKKQDLKMLVAKYPFYRVPKIITPAEFIAKYIDDPTNSEINAEGDDF